MSFPIHFPDDCPPKNAENAQGEVFRFVKNEPPIAEDFVSWFLSGQSYSTEKRCQACGLSVVRTEEDIKEARRISPWFKKRKVAKARLSADWGKLAITENAIPNHHTWWVSEGKEPHKIFDVVTIK